MNMHTWCVNPTPQQQAILNRYREEILTGQRFRTVAAAHRSVSSYQPPACYTKYARAVEALALFAHSGAEEASLASAILSQLPLYQGFFDMAAKANEVAAKCVRDGYDDAIGRTQPNAGRPSQYQRRYDLATLLHLDLVFDWTLSAGAPGPGWVLTDLLTQNDKGYLLEYYRARFTRQS